MLLWPSHAELQVMYLKGVILLDNCVVMQTQSFLKKVTERKGIDWYPPFHRGRWHV